MTPQEIALEIYKTISVSTRNDAYEAYQQEQFVKLAAPVIDCAIRQAIAQEREDCEMIAFDSGGGVGEYIAAEIRARSRKA